MPGGRLVAAGILAGDRQIRTDPEAADRELEQIPVDVREDREVAALVDEGTECSRDLGEGLPIGERRG